MTRLTIPEAARAGWGSRASLYRLVKAGRISTVLDGDRHVVDVAELVRVLGEPRTQRKTAAQDMVAAPDRADRAALEARVAELEQQRDRLDADLRAERDRAAADRDRMLMVIESAQKQAGAATKLLSDLRETAARPWWRRLLGS
jgi:hypothetical protein